jgi:phage repressor protein C with HTH and peptisase S24 domain
MPDDLRRRFKLALAAKSLDAKDIAQRLGVSKQVLSNALGRPTSAHHGPIAEQLGVSLSWLVTGEGAGPINSPSLRLAAREPDVGYSVGAPMDPVALRTIATATAGAGGGTAHDFEAENYKIPEGATTARIHGDSGGDLVWDGQWVVLAPEKRKPRKGNVVAVVTVDGATYLKRWFPADGGELIQLTSLSPRHPPILLPREDVAQVRVVVGTLWERM